MAHEHRLHQQDLRDLPLIFMPFRWVGYLIVSVQLGGLLIPERPMRTSLYVAACATAVIYEWSHLLIYTDYKQKTRRYRHLYDNRRWHHYHSKHYGFGASRPRWAITSCAPLPGATMCRCRRRRRTC